jgi:hypothetical protein
MVSSSAFFNGDIKYTSEILKNKCFKEQGRKLEYFGRIVIYGHPQSWTKK